MPTNSANKDTIGSPYSDPFSTPGEAAGGGGSLPASMTTPADLSELVAWWSTEDNLNISNGIYQFTDKSVNGLDLYQVTSAQRPYLRAAKYNGLPVAEFDATGDFLPNTGFLDKLTYQSNPVIWAYVRAGVSTAETGYMFSFGSFDDGISHLVTDTYNTITIRRAASEIFQKYDTRTTTSNVPYTHIYRFDGTSIQYYQNGVQIYDETMSEVPQDSTANMWLGSDYGGTTQSYRYGYFAEAFFANQDVAIADVHTYLSRWT